MGDRYELTVKCPQCGFADDDVWYAPTCGCMIWDCPKCKTIVDLEKYSGISAEGCANTLVGVDSVRRLKSHIRKKFGGSKNES